MFRTLVILGALACCAFAAGWFTIDRNEKETTIRFNRDEIREDASRAIAKGKELLEAHQNSHDQAEGESPNFVDQGQVPEGYLPPAGTVQPSYPQAYPQTYPPAPPVGGNQQATRPIPPWELPQSGQPGGARQF
ncbi:hypothetical protein U8335_21730 [Roseiconus lacunae]|uniref:hypothetical protein n=1 Tax=Roseiconus lacunae TaxID=2605694 RepID=UPI003092CE5F|nr:hypothetical protein U8335_21730 [Stieleria sp. HD01]